MDPNTAFTEAQMKIRRPASEVFNAFIDPEITVNFWFTKSSGKLEQGKKVRWDWEMYNVSAEVEVSEIIGTEMIAFEWSEPRRNVELRFTPLSDGSTYVTIKESGYKETGDALLSAIRDSTGGFTTVLDGLKAWLEHRIRLNLIADKFPAELHGKP